MLSAEMRKLLVKWRGEHGWPKFLERIEIRGIRGWSGQRIDLRFPMIAIVGENGAGKSTILQAIASVYKSPTSPKVGFASDFFPDTAWEVVKNASIRYTVKEGEETYSQSVRKHTDRWRGNPERRSRPVVYIDLRRTQPMSAQIGYSRIAKPQFKEADSRDFDDDKLQRLCAITGRHYDKARYALTDADKKRWVPVVESGDAAYSGFHQGAGEITLADLLRADFPRYGIILIDELETSLHPRSQRRLVRDLAEMCRVNEMQIIFTTHSPYVLEEVPEEGRLYVMSTSSGKSLITGVSPYFAMTKMDEDRHPELDLYVEDTNAGTMLEEVISHTRKELLLRCDIVPYGAASVGMSLGQMVSGKRFHRKSLVFLDADQERFPGCLLLPGQDAPERVVFEGLKQVDWRDVANRIGRSHSDTVDALEYALTLSDHHEWIKASADRLVVGGDHLWRGMCNCWAQYASDSREREIIVGYIESALQGIEFKEPENRTSNLPIVHVPKDPQRMMFD
jgi:predicted ATPase